jgi:glycine oxidase
LTLEQSASTTARVPRPSVLVVGAGVIGCAIAYELSPHADVLLLERSVPGAEASSVAAGILAPRIEHDTGPLLDLGLRSLLLHARWSEALAAGGLATGHHVCGALALSLDDDPIAREGARQLDRDALLRIEPNLGPSVRAGWLWPDEAQIEPPRLLRALALAAEASGARFRSGVQVQALHYEGERCRGVREVDGTLVTADVVVLAAGSWTGQIPGLPPSSGPLVRPVRGQLVHLDARRPPARHVLFGNGGYVVPRRDGRVIIGATMEDAGFDKTVTLGGAHDVTSKALTLLPSLAEAELISHAVSFRPGSVDDLPLIGPMAPGLLLATGHFRNGILLAPVTAEMIADQILERAPRHGGAPFLPQRTLGAPT